MDRYRSGNSKLARDLDDIRTRLRISEEDLGAARTSLRQMIRNRPMGVSSACAGGDRD